VFMGPTQQSVKHDGHLVVFASELCNLRCRFCMIGTEHGHMVRFSSDDIRQMLLYYRDRCISVSFSGGEPTLRPDLPDLVREAVALGYRVDISTNGRRFAFKEYCEELIKAGVSYFFISINGQNREIYKELAKVDAFDQTVAGIKNLVELGQKVITATVVSNYNYKHMDDIAKLIVDLKVNGAVFRFYRPGPKIEENDIFEVPSERVNDVLRSIERAVIYLYRSGINPNINHVPRCMVPSCSHFIKYYAGTFNGRDIYPRAGGLFYTKVDTGEDLNVVAGDRLRFWKEEGCKECINDKYCDGIMAGLPFRPKPMKYSPFV